MSTASCFTENAQTASCQAPSFPAGAHDPVGRRIYIHQDTFRNFAARGIEEAILIYRMTARTVALKAVHHVYEDSQMFGLLPEARAGNLQEQITTAWSANATQTMRQLGFHFLDPRFRFDLARILDDDEEIAASCYFSNYYTFATGEQTSKLMFDDKNDIATMRQMMQSSAEYNDLTMITGNCLVLIEPELGIGKNMARQYAGQLRRKETLAMEALEPAKQHVHRETTEALLAMLQDCLDLSDPGQCRVRENLLASIDAAFDKGILKSHA